MNSSTSAGLLPGPAGAAARPRLTPTAAAMALRAAAGSFSASRFRSKGWRSSPAGSCPRGGGDGGGELEGDEGAEAGAEDRDRPWAELGDQAPGVIGVQRDAGRAGRP